MKPLVGIVVGEKSDLSLISPTRDMLEEMDVPVDIIVLADFQDALEKLYLYALTAGLRGLEVLVMGGENIPCPVHALTSVTPVPIIYVPAGEHNQAAFVSGASNYGNTNSPLLLTPPGDAHAAGLWAVQNLASKNRSVYNSMQKSMQDMKSIFANAIQD